MRASILSVLMGLVAFTSAAEVSSEVYVVYGKWAKSDTCNPQTSQHVQLSDLLDRPETYRGVCVTTTGYKGGRALFLIKEKARARNSSDAEYADVRLGLYGSESTMEDLNDVRDKKLIRATGLVMLCDDLYDENTIMVMGYCHYTGGPIIGMASFEALKK